VSIDVCPLSFCIASEPVVRQPELVRNTVGLVQSSAILALPHVMYVPVADDSGLPERPTAIPLSPIRAYRSLQNCGKSVETSMPAGGRRC
jgi:hypothetical protein